jgi:hypothetical protein
MSDHALAAPPTRGAVFDPLVMLAKARVVRLVEEGQLDRDDGEFLLRALIDLESDGVELFGRDRPADTDFYTAVVEYLAARAGAVAVETPLIASASAEALAALGAVEGARVAQLLRLPQAPPTSRNLDRAVLELINHQGGRA